MLVTLFDSAQLSISTDILVVGNSLGGSCNTTDPGVDFPFELNSALQQCRPYVFSGYSQAIQPVVVFGLIPLGQTIVALSPRSSTSFDWVVNVAAGTSIIFIMIDSEGRNGGSSDIKQVGISNDDTCLNSTSPSSTARPTPTSTSSTSTTPVPPSSGSSSHGLSTGVIIGAGAGGLILIGVLAGLVFFCLRRRQDSRRHVRSDIDLSYGPTGAAPNVYPYPISSSTNLNRPDSPPPHSPPHHFVPPTQYEPRPFVPPPELSSLPYLHGRHSTTNSQSELLSTEPGEQSGSFSGSMSTAQRKAGMAGVTSYKPSRFILHTDADEAPQEEEIIELPPQYSDNRRPLQLLDPTSSPPSGQPSDHI